MYFAEFDGVGDRSVLVLDGRQDRLTQCENAHRWGVTHNFTKYRICRGENFIRYVPLTDWKRIHEDASTGS